MDLSSDKEAKFHTKSPVHDSEKKTFKRET